MICGFRLAVGMTATGNAAGDGKAVRFALVVDTFPKPVYSPYSMGNSFRAALPIFEREFEPEVTG